MLDPTTLPSTLRARALTRQADWAPKSEVGLVECGLLNPGPPARPPVCPSASPPDRPVRPSAPCTHRPPRPLRPRETAAAIYTPPLLPPDHPAPRSPRWAPSLCCAFKDCGTARGSRTSGSWSELRGKPLQFFLHNKQHGEGDHLHPGRPGYSSS